jgi:nucleotide-binding universal stress UspA family protein
MSQAPMSRPARAVLVAAIDATPASEHVVTVAAGLGQSMAGAELHILHVVDPTPIDPDAVPAYPEAGAILERGRSVLDRATEAARARFSGTVTGHLATGKPWREIVQFATNIDADLIVVGTHDRTGLKRLMLGSVAEQVTRRAQCAVLIARPKEHDSSVPEIEPPCPECVATQRASGGASLWCGRHAGRHPRGRLHYEWPASYGIGTMLLRPDQT